MPESFFPVQRSLLSASALAERVLPLYDLPGAAGCRFWRRGVNDAYLVEAGQARFVLRVSPARGRSREHLETEIDLLRFLDGSEVIVPQPVSQRDGTYVHVLHAPEGPRYAVLFTFVPGALPSLTEAHSRRFGRTVARFHAVTDDYPAGRAAWRFGPEEMVDRPLARLEPLFADHREDWDYLCQIAPGLKQAAARLARQAPQYGMCHGDVNSGNFILVDPDRSALLDFEYIGYGWRVFDVATFLGNRIYQLGQVERVKGIVDAFLDGYRSVRPLSQAERNALPSFVILRQIWLLGVGARNLPNIGLHLFQHWAFDRCMPLIRGWMREAWY